MKTVFLWLVPPLVGAIIGYVTNALAIKMLFRPLKAIFVLGIRLPFTPGILPRRRGLLAENIGKMVARELVTEDIIRERIRSDDFRLAIEKSIADYSQHFLDTPISQLALSVPHFPSTQNQQSDLEYLGASDFARTAGGLVDRFVQSEAFELLASKAVGDLIESLGEKSLTGLFGQDFPQKITHFLLSAENTGKLAAALECLILDAAKEDKALLSLLPPDIVASGASLAHALYPNLAKALLQFLNQKTVRSELESRGRVFMRDAIGELNTFQRFFISAAQYDRTLAERMPEIIGKFIARVEELTVETESRNRFAGSIQQGLAKLLAMPLPELAKVLNTDPSAFASMIAQRSASLLAMDTTKKGISDFISGVTSDYAQKPLRSVMHDYFGVDSKILAKNATTFLVTHIRQGAGSNFSYSADRFLKERGSETAAVLLGINAGEKDKIDRFLADRALSVFDEKISAALKTLDVRKLVADRINVLDMKDVERIVLDVLADQLQWINVFGALLGAIIGLSQSALNYFLR